ncbi:MAG: hypothetical protein ACOCQM_05900 [Natronomonas sp.]
MPHDLSTHVYELPPVEEWISGDNRVLQFTVVDGVGDPVDISDAEMSWALYERAYQDDPDDAVLSDSDSGVEVVTDSRVDTEEGEWEVRIDADATADDIWGEYWHRPSVEQVDDSRASWRGRVVVTA